MAQLRDAQTSELIAEGTPAELVILAEELGAGETLFDDVGNIDPAAVKAAHVADLEALEAAVADAPAGEQREAVKARRDERRELERRAKQELKRDARKRMDKARERAG